MHVEHELIYVNSSSSFGFQDGISNPPVDGFNHAPGDLPRRESIRPGILLVGHEGYPGRANLPAWATDGSFMVFRYLSQLVPEFNAFLKKNPIQLDGMSEEEGSEFLGARMVGRWKSGKSC